MNEWFIEKLSELGYFNRFASEETRSLQEEIRKRGWAGLFSDSRRLHSADAEDLAEGGIGLFIDRVAPFLATEGVETPNIEDNASADGYVVYVGGVAHPIYDDADLSLDSASEKPGLIWGLAMVRGFGIIDGLLEAAGSQERVYAVNGGNDLFAYFLTPELRRVIMDHLDSSPHDGPYKPTEEYPWFGQPH